MKSYQTEVICEMNKKNKNPLTRSIQKLGTALMAVLLLVGTIYGQGMDKGTYSIKNIVVHDNPVGQGMARSYTEEESQLEVTDQGIYLTLGFNNTQYMGDFAIKVDGSNISYQVISHNAQTNVKKLKFKIADTNSKVTVGMYVVPMDTEVSYTVTLNQSTLTLIKKAEDTADNGSSDQTNQGTQNTPSPGVPNNSTSQGNAINGTQSGTTVKPNNSQTAGNSTQSDAGTTPNNNGVLSDSSTQGSTTKPIKPQVPSSSDEEKEVVQNSSDSESVELEEAAEQGMQKELKEEITDTQEIRVLEVTADTPQESVLGEIDAVTSSSTLGEMLNKHKGGIIAVCVLSLAGIGIGVYYWVKKRKESGR